MWHDVMTLMHVKGITETSASVALTAAGGTKPCMLYLLCERRVVQHVPSCLKGSLGGSKPIGQLRALKGVVMVQDLPGEGRHAQGHWFHYRSVLLNMCYRELLLP
jgi:hypothetical protein